ncbi:MAG: hypothetical protein COS94_08555 [Candidatus Hydrogenedentes bacterium CG07_land_8_20_14_0_80_42_17]|nr:MAG: hypothetical protein COS94_08555 [Candidatus Hydrogenedentes bacterium CG07_land_8_20_14_0_80_42_17]
MKKICLILSTFIFAIIVRAEVGGLSPSAARRISSGEEISGIVRTSLYFDVIAEEDGELQIEATPISGEVDLAVVHYSGSPAIESRKEGLVAEEIALRVSKGDRFLIRVISPFSKPSEFKLKVLLPGLISESRIETSSEEKNLYYKPETNKSGLSAGDAIPLTIGKISAIESKGERYFQVIAPTGYLLEVKLYPVSGNADLEAAMVSKSNIIRITSKREGNLTDEVYVPVEDGGLVVLKVNAPDNEIARYCIVARLRQIGIQTLTPREEPNDIKLVAEVFGEHNSGFKIPLAIAGSSNAQVQEKDSLQSKILQLR